MSKGQTLRALVNERLAAAAEDIFVLFERTIAEYEEELCRSKEENQRKQHLLDKVLSPRIELVRENVQIPSTSPCPGLNQEITETPQIKEESEEQSVKQEEEQLPVPAPESSAVCVKTEESSLLQQRQTEHREETQGEDISSEPHFHSETEGYTDDNYRPSFSWSAAQMETEAEGDHYNQDQVRDSSTKLCPQNKSAPETTVHNEDVSGAERKKHRCPFCQKKFGSKQHLQIHITFHTGGLPYSWSISDKSLGVEGNSNFHHETFAGEKFYSCSFCGKTFSQKGNLERHIRTHTGEKPFRCSLCEKRFAQKGDLERHKRTHTGEKPFSCSTCKRTFARNWVLNLHKKTHTGEKPYSCTVCDKTFAHKGNLKSHLSTHSI